MRELNAAENILSSRVKNDQNHSREIRRKADREKAQ
jgi:hypothetical protein